MSRDVIEQLLEKHIQRCRDAVAKCPKWSPAQAEWSRARDALLNFQDDLRAAMTELEGAVWRVSEALSDAERYESLSAAVLIADLHSILAALRLTPSWRSIEDAEWLLELASDIPAENDEALEKHNRLVRIAERLTALPASPTKKADQ